MPASRFPVIVCCGCHCEFRFCTAGAYGSTKRYKSFDRLRKVNESCIVGAGGELSDFQYIMRYSSRYSRLPRWLYSCMGRAPGMLQGRGCSGGLPAPPLVWVLMLC